LQEYVSNTAISRLNTIDNNAAMQYIVDTTERPQLRKNEWHLERQADIPSDKRCDAGRDQGIAFLKHPNNMEKKMTQTFFKGLTDFLCGQRSSAAYRKDLMTWAKTEYPKDWEFAYNYMLRHNGKAPEYRGMTL